MRLRLSHSRTRFCPPVSGRSEVDLCPPESGPILCFGPNIPKNVLKISIGKGLCYCVIFCNAGVVEPFPLVWHNVRSCHSFSMYSSTRGSQALSHEDTRLLLPADSAWLALESPENPMTITVMMRVEELTGDRLSDFLAVYWLAWERFRCIPTQHAPVWRWEPDPAFSLSHHLEVVGDAFDEQALQAWVSARLNQPLPDYRPRWKFWLLPNAEGGAALLLRIHHCYADGLSLMGVFEQICTRSPQQAPVIYGGREGGEFRRWSGAMRDWLTRLRPDTGRPDVGEDLASMAADLPATLERTSRIGMRAFSELSQFLAEPADTASSLKAPLLGRRVCRWSGPLALNALQAAAHGLGCTINDMLLASVTGAIRDHLQAAGAALDDASVHAAMPVDIRHRLPETLQPAAGVLGNYFGTVFVPLPVDGDSSLEHLYRVKHETRRLKQSWQPGIAWGLTGSACLLPGNARETLRDLMCGKASAVVSNVPGTRDVRFLAGCRIREQMCWVPQAGGIGLGISIVSYAGQVQFGVVADEAILPEPEPFLARCLGALNQYLPA